MLNLLRENAILKKGVRIQNKRFEVNISLLFKFLFRILFAKFKSLMIWVSHTRNRTRRSISLSNKIRGCC